MTRRLSMLVVAAALSACGSSDGYQFDVEDAEYERDTFGVELVKYGSSRELQAAAARLGAIAHGRETMAFSELHDGGCRVHIVDPAKEYRPEWLGHEIMHCAYGRWHGPQ